MQLINFGANQAVLRFKNGNRVLFSYDTPVAMFDNDTGDYFMTSAKWSNSTTRHVRNWLQANLKPGQIAKVVDQSVLNNIMEPI